MVIHTSQTTCITTPLIFLMFRMYDRQKNTHEIAENYYFARYDNREKSHVFYRDGNTYFYNKNVFSPSYILVDPRPLAVKIAIQVKTSSVTKN